MGDGMLARKAAALSFLSSISTVSPAHQQLQLTDGAHNSQGPSGKGSVPPMRVLSSPAEETTSSEGAWTPKQRATISFLRNIDLGSSHPVSESSGLSRALSHSLDALESPRPTASDAEVLACPTDVFAGELIKSHREYPTTNLHSRPSTTSHHLVAARAVQKW